MKLLVFLCSILTMVSCVSNAENKEIAELKKANHELKEKLRSYENAIVITSDNFHNYVGGIVFGPETVKKNEKFSVSSAVYLHLRDWKGEVRWEPDQENQSETRSDKVLHHIDNLFPGAGERTISGKYTFVFPDGQKKEVPWEKNVLVK